MGLIRLILLGVVIWLIMRMVKKFQAGQEQQGKVRKNIDHDNMVPCDYCSVHVPQSSAVQHGQLWFCSENHKDKYLTGKS